MGPRKRVKPNPLETPAAEVPLPKETEASEDLKRPSEPLQVPEDAKVEDGNVTELVTQGADRVRIQRPRRGCLC